MRLIKKYYPPFVDYIRDVILHRVATLCYAQEGEDLILSRFFENATRGFYVDIGAHDPKRFSNTYYFYKRGWRGINVDATPGSMAKFRSVRPEDINVECAIASVTKAIPFYMFPESALNTFDKKLAHQRKSHGIQQVELIPTKLKTILDEYLPPNTAIDFMNIDVEGRDLDVLRSNDWSRYRPAIILVESLHESRSRKLREDAIYQYLIGKKYGFLCNTMNTLFFIDTIGKHRYTTGEN